MAPPPSVLLSSASQHPPISLHSTHLPMQCPLPQAVALPLPAIAPPLPAIAPPLPAIAPPLPAITPLVSAVDPPLSLRSPVSSINTSISMNSTTITSIPSSLSSVPSSLSSVPASLSSIPASLSSVPASLSSVPASLSSVPASLLSISDSLSSVPASLSSVPASLSSVPASLSSVPASLLSVPQPSEAPPTLSSAACAPPSSQLAPPTPPQALASRGASVCPQPHHEQEQLCLTRPSYRQGRHLKAVKVYTVNDESVYLLVARVPALHLQRELCKLCSRYGQLVRFTLQPSYPGPPFTETWLAKYASVKQARFAKRLLDGKNFFGGLLHVCYAPELEDVMETRSKLHERRRAYQAALCGKNTSTKAALDRAVDGEVTVLHNNLELRGRSGTGWTETAAVIGPEYHGNACSSSSGGADGDGGTKQRSLLSHYHPDDKLSATMSKVAAGASSDLRGDSRCGMAGVHLDGSDGSGQFSEANEESINAANNHAYYNDVSSEPSLNTDWASCNRGTSGYTSLRPADGQQYPNINWHQCSLPSASTSNGADLEGEPPSDPPRLGATYASMTADYEPGIGLVSGEQYRPVPEDLKSSAKCKLNSKKISLKRKSSEPSTSQPIFNLQQQNRHSKKRKTASITSHTAGWSTSATGGTISATTAAAGSQASKSAYGRVKAAIRSREGAGQEQLLRLQRVLSQALPPAVDQRLVRQAPDRQQPGKITLADGATLL